MFSSRGNHCNQMKGGGKKCPFLGHKMLFRQVASYSLLPGRLLTPLEVVCTYNESRHMLMGQMLSGQMQSRNVYYVYDCHKNIPLQFKQNRESTSRDVADIETNIYEYTRLIKNISSLLSPQLSIINSFIRHY